MGKNKNSFVETTIYRIIQSKQFNCAGNQTTGEKRGSNAHISSHMIDYKNTLER